MGGRAWRRRYYDLFARVYDRFVAWHSGEPTGPMRRALAERAAWGTAWRVLDLCCGTGAVTRVLAGLLGSDSLVVGLDFSSGMLGQGRTAAGRAGLSAIRWVQADASALPFRAGTFDAAACAYVLYELKGGARRAMLCEVVRVLAPGGRFLAMEHEVPTRPLPRLLFFLRLAVIGAEGARAFLGGEIDELGHVFSGVEKELVPPGKSKILTGRKCAGRADSAPLRGAGESGDASREGQRGGCVVKIVYGPVPSWPIGRSLGVDALGGTCKRCTFDCVYCQLGPTPPGLVLRDAWVDPAVLTAELAGRLAGTVRVARLNVDENPGKAGSLGVRSIPTLLLFNHGKVIGQMVGAAAAPLP
jgi:demethylmenaquinone methyltransferase/2-methoxy-6-polyprenyl-1,4-benzoquinol methylase